ncbi:MAG: hypothetical protein AB4368_12365 [Xenococcaceae cyanobacterium]
MTFKKTNLTLTNRADLPLTLELGSPVQIVKGSLQGSKGVIAGYTSDEIYFIWRDCDRRERGCPPVPDGPFLRNEFELLEAKD